MRILLTNDSLNFFTGTESWTYAMAKELSKRHEVVVFTNWKGQMARQIEEICPVISQYSGEYDIAIVNHKTCWDKLPKDLPKIFTSHSKIFDIEQPPCNNYVGINENVGGKIIRNGIDCERFKPTKVNQELQNILLLSNPNYSGSKEFIKQATQGYNLIIIEEETFEIEKYINQADLVISLSRGALESMACGKNVIYGDFRRDWMGEFQAVGMITKANFEDFKQGKMVSKLKPFSVMDLKKELAMYNPDRGEWLREQVVKDFNIEKTSRQYEELAYEIINNLC